MHTTDTAFVAIDVQNDFCPGGALAVAGGDKVVPIINRLAGDYAVRVFTQDWHPADHASFADNHEDAEPYSMIDMAYGPQVLWPRHCVIGSDGAAFHADLQTDPADLIIRKGFRPEIDSYSAFFENDKTTPTGLTGYLRERGVTKVVLSGLATDFCVFYSAMDAVKQGFEATVLLEACRGIDLNGSMDAALNDMKAVGVSLSQTA